MAANVVHRASGALEIFLAVSFKQSLQKIFFIFSQQSKALNEDEKIFCEKWLNDRYDTIATIGVVLAAVYHFVCIFTDYLVVSSSSARQFLLYSHLAVLGFLLAWFAFAQKKQVSIRYTNIPLQILTAVGYIAVLAHYLESAGVADEKAVKARTGYIVICVFLLLHTAYRGTIIGVLALFYWAGAWYCWSFTNYGPGILIITALIFSCTLNFKWAYSMSYKYEALREFENRKTLKALEQQKYAHELELARQIQDSLSPPSGIITGNLKAICLQKKHSSIGGDWVGIRLQADDSVIVAVADATGKGMQAALVVHALQSLWAEALDHPDFDPEIWLKRVNLTMLRLGEKQPHSLSMGLMKVFGKNVTYWSAGHVPLIVSKKTFSGEEVRVVPSTGDFLGMSKNFKCTPGRFEISDMGNTSLLLGTDGVFNHGTLVKPREVTALLERLRADPNSALDQCQSEDDKTLVWLQSV